MTSPVACCSCCAACSNARMRAIASLNDTRHSECVANSNGSFSMSSACKVAAETLRKTFEGCVLRSGVAVNSKIQLGFKRTKVSKANGVP